jgi:hypothetical protein
MEFDVTACEISQVSKMTVVAASRCAMHFKRLRERVRKIRNVHQPRSSHDVGVSLQKFANSPDVGKHVKTRIGMVTKRGLQCFHLAVLHLKSTSSFSCDGVRSLELENDSKSAKTRGGIESELTFLQLSKTKPNNPIRPRPEVPKCELGRKLGTERELQSFFAKPACHRRRRYNARGAWYTQWSGKGIDRGGSETGHYQKTLLLRGGCG